MDLYYYSLLPEGQKQLYITLWRALGRQQIPCQESVPEIGAVLKAILMDHPEFCFFEGKWGYENGVICPLYGLSPVTMQELENVAKTVSGNFPAADYPQLVYEWMLTEIGYDPGASNSQNAYGALVRRRAVCKGIAKAYQLLMKQRNIDCILVEGTLDGRTKHVWNMIFLDGKWLHVDVTMGYPLFRPLVGAQDKWGGFMLTTEAISQSHGIRNRDSLPK